MEMCSYRVPEPGVRDLEISGIQDRPNEVTQHNSVNCLWPSLPPQKSRCVCPGNRKNA